MMRGFLKTPGWDIKLQPITTKIGRQRDCDLCLQNGGIEDYHAFIAWSEAEGCFVLTDLNSAHGTFVNDCRIHNAAVRLAPGDKLHFGHGGPTYQLDVESPSQLPLLPGPYLAPQAWICGVPSVTPKPPSQARPRPASAGAKRSGQQSRPAHQETAVQRPVSWTGNTRSRSPHRALAPPPCHDQTMLQHLLQEKEERLQRLGDELCRLAFLEAESHRKDGVICELREQVTDLRQQLAQNQTTTSDPEVKRRLRCLERGITDKKQQIQQLKEQVVALQSSSIEITQQSVKERDMKISCLRGQMEKIKKDSTTAAGLVSSLQKDLSSREKQAVKLASEVDRLQQDIRHRDIQLESNNTKLAKISKKHQEELRDCENKVLMMKKSMEKLEDTLREKDKFLQQQVTENSSLKAFWEKKLMEQESLLANSGAERQSHLQRNQAELEQMESRVKSFRSQLCGMLAGDGCCDPSDSSSQDARTDQQVLERIANQLAATEEMKARMQEMEEELKQNSLMQNCLVVETEKLRSSVDDYQRQMQDAGSIELLEGVIGSLKEESVSAGLGWIQTSVISLMTGHLSLLQKASQAFHQAAVQVSDTPEGILNGIQTLCQEHQTNNVERQRLEAELEEIRGRGQNRGQQEELDQTREELEQQRLQMKTWEEEEQNRQKELEEMKVELEALREAQSALQQESQTQQNELLSKLKEMEGREEEGRGREKEAWERGREEERERCRVQEEEYREQVRQHAHTIVALEQRWGQARLRADRLEEEMDSLRTQLSELEKHQPEDVISPVEPVKPPEVAALEDTISSLRLDLSQAQQENHNQGDIIAALSSDLAAANARITDMTGELSEQQKVELEQHKAALVEQRVQLSTLTQKLSMMSQLVEQKGEELRKAREDLRQCQAELEKKTNAETELRHQCPDQSSANLNCAVAGPPQCTEEVVLDAASKGPTKQGSKCKGHRHDKVIQQQREALDEMRASIRTLGRMSASRRLSQQGVLKSQNKSESQRAKLRSAGTKDSVTSSNGWTRPPEQHEDETLERTARLELTDALDLSERTYIDLARALCEALELSEGQLEGLASMQHLPQEERARLGSQRHRDLELLRSQLALQSSHIQRRDTVIQEQSKEIGSLRQSQAEGLQLRVSLENLRADLEKQTQETSLLRQALEQQAQKHSGRHSLPMGKNLKMGSQEKTQRKLDRIVSHSCVNEKAAAKTGSLRERLKKMEEQNETLKTQLEERDREFHTMATKLANQQRRLQQQQQELRPQTPSLLPEPC